METRSAGAHFACRNADCPSQRHREDHAQTSRRRKVEFVVARYAAALRRARLAGGRAGDGGHEIHPFRLARVHDPGKGFVVEWEEDSALWRSAASLRRLHQLPPLRLGMVSHDQGFRRRRRPPARAGLSASLPRSCGRNGNRRPRRDGSLRELDRAELRGAGRVEALPGASRRVGPARPQSPERLRLEFWKRALRDLRT